MAKIVESSLKKFITNLFTSKHLEAGINSLLKYSETL